MAAAIAALGRVPAALLCVAALALAVMYCSNDNFDADPAAPRGDGRYRPVLARGDGHMHFLITRSLVFDGDFNLDNDLARFGDPWNQPLTPVGRKNVMQQLGPSLVWAPLLAAARGAAAAVNAFGGEIEPHGYTLFHQRILFASSVVFAWLAMVLGVACARRVLGGRWGPAWGGVAVLLGTSLTYYATYMPSYAHAMDAAAAAGFLALWIWTLGDLRWRRFVALGALLGIAAMVRVQDLGLGIAVALELAVIAVRQRRGVVGNAGRGALCLAIACALHAPQLYAWHVMFGEWLTTPQGPGWIRYGHPMVLEVLFSSRNGWLSTTPIAYLGAIGLIAGAIAGPRLGARARFVCIALLLVIATQVYTNAITYEWWSGASFGQRRMSACALPNIVGIAALLRVVHLWVRAWWRHAIAIGVFGYLIAWNLNWVGALRNGRTAGIATGRVCCAEIPAPLAAIARPIYRAVGNPFALPASAWFAIRHGVPLDRWDVAVGDYALFPDFLKFADGSYRRARATWNPDARYLLRGFGPRERDAALGAPVIWTAGERAELLLPLLLPEPHRIAIPIRSAGDSVEIVIRCNGEIAARAAVGAQWTTVTFDTDGSVGESTISVEAAARVAIGPWQIALPPRPLGDRSL